MILYGDVKDELAASTDNGITSADTRMIPFVNSAMRALTNAMKPRGVFVGSTISATVALDATTRNFNLPPAMDVAFTIENASTADALPNGWFNIISSNVLVDPDDIMDTTFVDLGVNTAGIRSYHVPEAPAAVTQLLVFGLKTFVPVVNDTTPLFVQNVEAIKWWLLSMFKGQTQDDRQGAKELRGLAVEELSNELQRHLDDPQRYAARLARWRTDETTYLDGTLGNIAARMAQTFGTGQRVGRIKLYRMVNEAAREAVQMFNALGRTERYSNVNGPNQLTFTKANTAQDPLSYTDYEVLEYLVKSAAPSLSPADITSGKAAAMDVVTRNIAIQTDAARSSARYARLAAFQPGTLGSITARMGLEVPTTTTALTYSDNQYRRWVNEAAARAIEHYNFLTRTDRFSLVEGPAPLSFTYTTDDAGVLPYQNYDVLSLLVQEQIIGNSGEEAAALRDKAFGKIAENLAAVVDAARNTARHARLALDPASVGYLTARLGLEVPDSATALTISDSQLKRQANEAAREALQHRNFLSRSERYSNLAGPDPAPFAVAVDDADPLSYPDLEVLTRLVSAQMAQDAATARGLRDEAQTLIERNLQKAIEAFRNAAWHCLLISNPFPQFGGARAQIGLEYGGDGGADGYKLSDGFISRLVQEAWAMAVDQFNFLSRGEDYEQLALGIPAAVPANDAIIPFSMEVLKLYAEALVVQDKNESERATSYKQQATTLVERNLVAAIERARRIVCEQQILTGMGTTDNALVTADNAGITVDQTQVSAAYAAKNTFGYVVGRLGLELTKAGASVGLSISDAKRRRLVNEAEELLADSGRWKFMEQEFLLTVGADGSVVMPADVENVIAAEVCGMPVDLKGRLWLYLGCAVRNAGGWEGWGSGYGGFGGYTGAGVPLLYSGPDTTGNATYRLGTGCAYPFNVTYGNGLRPPLRALCRRKWLMKDLDGTPMLIQSYPAIKRMVQAVLDGEAGDQASKATNYNGALKALDNQLAVETEGQDMSPSVELAGLPLGGGRGRHWRGTRY